MQLMLVQVVCLIDTAAEKPAEGFLQEETEVKTVVPSHLIQPPRKRLLSK